MTAACQNAARDLSDEKQGFSFRLKSQDKLVTYAATHDSKNIYSSK